MDEDDPEYIKIDKVIASNGVPFLQMRSVGSHSISGREKEGKQERSVEVIVT